MQSLASYFLNPKTIFFIIATRPVKPTLFAAIFLKNNRRSHTGSLRAKPTQTYPSHATGTGHRRLCLLESFPFPSYPYVFVIPVLSSTPPFYLLLFHWNSRYRSFTGTRRYVAIAAKCGFTHPRNIVPVFLPTTKGYAVTQKKKHSKQTKPLFLSSFFGQITSAYRRPFHISVPPFRSTSSL